MASASYQHCIARANELGYFPTLAQAKEISERSAARYGKMIEDGEVQRLGAVNEAAYAACNDWAIRAVMEKGKSGEVLAATISGVSPGL